MGACGSSSSSSAYAGSHKQSGPQAAAKPEGPRRQSSLQLPPLPLPSPPMLLGKSEHRQPPTLPDLKQNDVKLVPPEPETLYTENPQKLQAWDTEEDQDEDEEDALAPLPQAEHIGWVARERQHDPRALDRSGDFLALLQDVRAGNHALVRRWDLCYLLVPGFFHGKYATYMEGTRNHLMGLGLHCRIAHISSGKSVAENAETIAEYVEELSVMTSKRVVLVGHSRGGCDAVAAVARYNERLRQRVAGVVCLQSPLGGMPIAGDFVGKRLRGRVLRTIRCVLGNEVDALGDATYESRREELEAFPYPHGAAPIVTFASETTRKGSVLEPLASHTRRRYQGVANDGLAACADAHLPCSTMVQFTADWDHGACAFREPSLQYKEQHVNEALIALLVQEVPTMGPSVDTALTPIYDFWNRSRREHTFHHGDPWSGEQKKRISFYAFSCEAEGAEPVYSFWNKEYSVHTFHMGEPLEGERQVSIQFYAFPHPMPGAEPVFSFWHEENADYSIHVGEPASGELKKELLFYAYRFPGPLCSRAKCANKIDRV